MNTIYRPRADGLPARVLAFFTSNLDEELNLDDITEKFDATRGNIHTLLAEPLRLGLLARKKNEDGEYIYSRGTALKADQQPPASEPPRPPRAKAAAPLRKMLDIGNLKVEEGIPYLGDVSKGKSKWSPLFAKLIKPGQSLAIPADMRGAVGAAANKLNKSQTQGRFRVAMTSADEARVWRIA